MEIHGLVVGFPGRIVNFDSRQPFALPRAIDLDSTVTCRGGGSVVTTVFAGGKSIRVTRDRLGEELVYVRSNEGGFLLDLPKTYRVIFLGPNENLAQSQTNFKAVQAPSGSLGRLVVDRCFTSALGDGTWGTEVEVNGVANRIELRDYRDKPLRMRPITGKWRIDLAEGARIDALEIQNQLGETSGILHLSIQVRGDFPTITVRLLGCATVSQVTLTLDGTDPYERSKVVGDGCSIEQRWVEDQHLEILLSNFTGPGQLAQANSSSSAAERRSGVQG